MTPEYQSILQQLIRRPRKGLSSQTLRLMGLNTDTESLEKQGSRLKDVMKAAAKTLSKG